MSNYFPTCMSRNPSDYYLFRIRILYDITSTLGKTEIRRSLKTRSRTKALHSGNKLSQLTQSLFAQISAANGGNSMTELSKTDINNILT